MEPAVQQVLRRRLYALPAFCLGLALLVVGYVDGWDYSLLQWLGLGTAPIAGGALGWRFPPEHEPGSPGRTFSAREKLALAVCIVTFAGVGLTAGRGYAAAAGLLGVATYFALPSWRVLRRHRKSNEAE